jgi:hypothetical protein
MTLDTTHISSVIQVNTLRALTLLPSELGLDNHMDMNTLTEE